MNNLKEKFKKQQFNPGLLGIFINPFYLVRKSLFKHIRDLSNNLSGSLLDVGCGSKPYQPLFKNVTNYMGLEWASSDKNKQNSANLIYDGHLIPAENAHFDSILLTQVLEHVFNPDELLNEIYRVIKPGGHVLATTPFVWDEHEQPYDYGRYSSFGLKHLFEKHGFKILEQRKTVDDFSAICQLTICYIHKKLTWIKSYRFRLCFYIIFISPFTIMGIILSKILPKNKDFYMDNIILAEKI